MQTMSSQEQSIARNGVLAGLLISRDDVTTLARLLDDVGSTLSVDPTAATSLLERAGGLVADMLGSGRDRHRHRGRNGRPGKSGASGRISRSICTSRCRSACSRRWSG